MPGPVPPDEPSEWTDLARPPLRELALRRALVVDGGLWRELGVVRATGSTNADLVARAAAGAPEGVVLVAEHQSAGRGRLDRSWTAPPRSGLALSVLLRPAVPPGRWPWLPLLAGLAVVDAVTRVAEVDAVLKWPNDVLVGERKLAGVLVERAGSAAVVGVGLNVSLAAAELPAPGATSLALEGAASTDRGPLLRAVLRALARGYGAWQEAGGDPGAGLREAYLAACATVGRTVAVALPGGATLSGTAIDVDREGRLVVATPEGTTSVGAGDVVHVR